MTIVNILVIDYFCSEKTKEQKKKKNMGLSPSKDMLSENCEFDIDKDMFEVFTQNFETQHRIGIKKDKKDNEVPIIGSSKRSLKQLLESVGKYDPNYNYILIKYVPTGQSCQFTPGCNCRFTLFNESIKKASHTGYYHIKGDTRNVSVNGTSSYAHTFHMKEKKLIMYVCMKNQLMNPTHLDINKHVDKEGKVLTNQVIIGRHTAIFYAYTVLRHDFEKYITQNGDIHFDINCYDYDDKDFIRVDKKTYLSFIKMLNEYIYDHIKTTDIVRTNIHLAFRPVNGNLKSDEVVKIIRDCVKSKKNGTSSIDDDGNNITLYSDEETDLSGDDLLLNYKFSTRWLKFKIEGSAKNNDYETTLFKKNMKLFQKKENALKIMSVLPEIKKDIKKKKKNELKKKELLKEKKESKLAVVTQEEKIKKDMDLDSRAKGLMLITLESDKDPKKEKVNDDIKK